MKTHFKRLPSGSYHVEFIGDEEGENLTLQPVPGWLAEHWIRQRDRDHASDVRWNARASIGDLQDAPGALGCSVADTKGPGDAL